MKKNHNAVNGRQGELLELLRKKREIPVKTLAEHFGVSLMTIRRDLHELEDKHLVNHQYGKAVLVHRIDPHDPEAEVLICREKIARYAAQFVEDGDQLFVNGSSTALKLLEYVNKRKVNVYTNNIRAVDKTYPSGITMNLTGGEIRGHVLVGDYVMRNLLTLSADKTFLGCAAVYTNGEFRYDIPTEIGINESMLARTKKDVYFLADHTKIHNHTLIDYEKQYGSCTYDCNITLITDSLADPECVELLKRTGMNVIMIS